MEPKDIIGKEFTCFKFELPDKLIRWDSKYEECLEKTAIVESINSTHPQYANAKVNIAIGRTRKLHFPTQMIIEQLELAKYDDKSVEELLNDMKQLISTI
jgi:hypothetical protein